MGLRPNGETQKLMKYRSRLNSKKISKFKTGFSQTVFLCLFHSISYFGKIFGEIQIFVQTFNMQTYMSPQLNLNATRAEFNGIIGKKMKNNFALTS